MAYEMNGKLNSIMAAETFGANGFTKRLFSITIEDGQYPQTISLELHTNHVDVIDMHKVGDEITVTFDIRGREIPDGRVFNSLVCWKIVGVAPSHEAPSSAPEVPGSFDDFETEDVPF